MVNYDFPLDELAQWNDDERFYKDYYEAKREGREKAFLRESDADEELKSYVKNPEVIEKNKTEEKFFVAQRNVGIIKHPRYIPIFYHDHNFFEILFVLSGHCRQMFHDKEMELVEGDFCLIAPGVRHAVSVFDESVILNIVIRRSTFLDIFMNTVRNKSKISLFFLGNIYEKRTIRYMVFHTAGDEELRNIILDMYMEQIYMDEYSDRIVCSMLTIFFNQLTRKFGKTVEIPDAIEQKGDAGERMLSYVMDHYADISIKKLAAQFHFSEPYCSKIIKEVSGMTFTELLTSVRIQRSENLLMNTQMSVEEISDVVGYKNPETFIRSFRRVLHQSPSQYRKNPAISI